jgi:hypothetical protein
MDQHPAAKRIMSFARPFVQLFTALASRCYDAHLRIPACKAIKNVESIEGVQLVHGALPIQQEGVLVHGEVRRAVGSLIPPTPVEYSVLTLPNT